MGAPRFNPDIAAVAAPPIPAAREWAARYGGRLGPPIDLTQAVPGYPPHPDLVAHLAGAARDPDSFGYGDIAGDLPLREAYAAEVSAIYGGEVQPDEVAITAGANMASLALTMLVARAGEAVMLPLPWYFNHHMNAGLLGIEPVGLPCRAEDGFVPDPAEAERLLTDRVRAILLVTPNNPTGAVYPPEVVAAFADLCRRRGIWLVLDETYRDFLPEGASRPHDLLAGEWRDTVVQIYSFSKSYCLPGYRAGAVVAGPEVIAGLAKILDCMQICAPRVGQLALAWAIPALRDWRAGNRRLMNARADACRTAFAGLNGWHLDASGSYFAYLRHPFETKSSWEVAERLAAETGVMVLPGEAFGPGQDRHLRLAFANVDEARLAEAAGRLAGFGLG